MHPLRSHQMRSRPTVWSRFANGIVAVLFSAVALLAQDDADGGVASGVGTPSLASIHGAAQSQDVTATRLRRFRSDSGAFVTVRELFESKVQSGSVSREVSFLAVEGEPSGSALSLQWSRMYGQFALLLANTGSFGIRDLPRANANYAVYDFGQVVRAGRSAQRLVVFPNQLDRAFWVIDADLQTSALLYSAEFDGQVRLLSEVEVIAFQPTARSLTGSQPPTYTDFSSACAQMNVVTGLMDPDLATLPSYSLDFIEVRDDVLSGRQMLVCNYSDGIDQVMVVQIPGTTDWFAGLPATNRGGKAIGRRFRDPTMSVHMFWEEGVTFHVAAGGASVGLDGLAKSLYRQAIATK